ncbi:hypothetical protein A0H81_01165 [Grifola frondosa]|uniref:Uncharacterized protein n=1 Tax=Grifola frondosa TaxID=5627 RepID=A0A1C7MR37_GRIFR|nr:hypothetical protein A0H81_01165 [Grifola frondosa]
MLKTRAADGKCAEYWSQQEQEARLQAAFEKWASKENVWTAAASKVHVDQLNHVKKGCLARPREDIAADGSRIEGSHKGWNSLMRSFASGLEVFTALGHDFVLRRNIRIATSRAHSSGKAFINFTHGSHHVYLTNHINSKWNLLLVREKQASGLRPRPLLRSASSGETFGLVVSDHSSTFGGLLQIKNEPESDDLKYEAFSDSELDVEPEVVMAHLNIDPTLLLQPLSISSLRRPSASVQQSSIQPLSSPFSEPLPPQLLFSQFPFSDMIPDTQSSTTPLQSHFIPHSIPLNMPLDPADSSGGRDASMENLSQDHRNIKSSAESEESEIEIICDGLAMGVDCSDARSMDLTGTLDSSDTRLQADYSTGSSKRNTAMMQKWDVRNIDASYDAKKLFAVQK